LARAWARELKRPFTTDAEKPVGCGNLGSGSDITDVQAGSGIAQGTGCLGPGLAAGVFGVVRIDDPKAGPAPAPANLIGRVRMEGFANAARDDELGRSP
jgi:hypothetical protein